jgi:hypothetical protein
MMSVIFVDNDSTTVTIYSTETKLDLVPLDSSQQTVSPQPSGGVATATLDSGVYKLVTNATPSINGSGIEVVTTSGKDDPPPEPTLIAKLQQASPGSTTQELTAFLVVPDARSFSFPDLASGQAAGRAE